MGLCVGPGGHQWAWRGAASAREGQLAGIGCETPVLLGCDVPGCAERLVVKCQTSNGAQCGPCSTEYRSRVRRVSRSGLRVVRPGQAVMLTLSAPGVRAHYVAGAPCPCTPEAVDPAGWNGTEGKRWNRVITQLRRMFGEQLDYFCGIETQGRGMLHRHAVIRADFASLVLCPGRYRRAGRELICRPGACGHARAYALCLADVRALAMRFGYGHEVDWSVLEDGEHAARYVSKYVTKSSAERGRVPWVRELRPDSKTRARVVAARRAAGEPCPDRPVLGLHPTYRLWTCSRCWGDSMGQVVALQRAYAELVAGLRRCDHPATAPVLAVLVAAAGADPPD